MINALFLSFSGYSEYNGISKKKLAQIKGLKECGLNVMNCYYTLLRNNEHRVWMIDDVVLIDLGKGILAKLKKRTNYVSLLTYIIEKRISFVYMRYEHNANPFLIHFVRRLMNQGVKVVMEIPTFPYDQEYITIRSKCSLFIDKLFRKRLAKQLNAIVTFSNESEIFGQRTIRISNGIDFNSIKLKRQRNHSSDEIHLVGVAEIHYWHGFDRVVKGLANYYKSDRHNACKIYFHIVGEFSGERERTEIVPLIIENKLENYIILHGKLFGISLDGIFDRSDIGIGSLARHRSNITYIKTLKNREYAARGIPFIYSETDEDFESMPYILKVPADESPIDITQIFDV
jgi:glycosyltransferase involved in cell wall biosynthesis